MFRTLAVLAAAVAVGWASAATHLARACVEADTPWLALCPAPASPAQTVAELRERLRRNPGDGLGWARLLVAETPAQQPAVLAGAAALAPNDVNVARWRAAQALERGELAEAAALLTQIVRTRGSPEAAAVLAQLAATPQGLELLRGQLQAGAERWLPPLLAAAQSARMPAPQLLPLLADAQRRGVLPQPTQRTYLRWLKASGAWQQAHGLWLAGRPEATGLLANGGFDAPFEPDGFDWEFAPQARTRAGVLLAQEPAARRGLVLALQFTGRSFRAPLLHQQVPLDAGSYRLQGDYAATRLRSEAGLAWAVQCLAGQGVLARSTALQDSGGHWQRLDLQFTVPPDCGGFVRLQLEPVAPYEAVAGLRGQVLLDAFALARLE